MRIGRVVTLFAAVGLGAALGLFSAWLALREDLAFGAVRAGPWVAHPQAGGLDRDPYAAAAIARTGRTPFDVAEGVAFFASVDSSGAPLDGACDYGVRGAPPQARFWTLAVTDPQGRILDNPARRYGFTSTEMVRAESGHVETILSPRVHPGMWLPTPGLGRLTLALRLYDASASALAASLKAADMPRIERVGCS